MVRRRHVGSNVAICSCSTGLYVEGAGGMRFERNYLIAASGFELLTHHHVGL